MIFMFKMDDNILIHQQNILIIFSISTIMTQFRKHEIDNNFTKWKKQIPCQKWQYANAAWIFLYGNIYKFLEHGL